MSNGTALTSQIRTLNLAGAKIALVAAEKFAVEKDIKVSVAVVDSAGNLVAFLRMDGAPLGTIDASTRKAKTAALFGAPSKVFEDLLHGGNTSLLAFDSVAPSQGGVPVIVDGVCVGAVGGSGASGEEDEAAARAGVEGLLAAL
jgi:glc operon protein GlcG